MRPYGGKLIRSIYKGYIGLLTILLLGMGLYQLYNTVSTCIQMRVIGTDRLQFDVIVYYMYAFYILVAIAQIAAGVVGIKSIVINLPMKGYKMLVLLLCLIQGLIIIRDILWGNLHMISFSYLHRILIISLPLLSQKFKRG